ncbi:MAG: Queuine tRNA-ribosyltransferase [Candidatus Roizmanbacteria bacterium GW2011_GWA2_35_8]|uniref:Queuine tRNA-ribosyltransferase n=1 Tax=Candidatus Roizmanbacteria bacterium GW2011_GWA2_35_8 TaxID=1618479 RepID=A0A0G0CWR1_9BACT|nr:MAG: Queuine tRNA-ribosyltransferase [Candidatus Roizmanbacteria bacterium GW2011_GWA2_35_8]
MNNFFEVLHNPKKSKARLGEIKTDHGVIKTPAFVPVGTKGTIKALTPRLVKDIGVQVAFVNTYHLVTHPGTEIIGKAGGIHKYSGLNIPLMSDSGGFQVFSLAREEKTRHRVLSTASPQGGPRRLSQKQMSSFSESSRKKADVRNEEKPSLVKISEDGVKFRSTFDGKLIEFTPEKSIEFQKQIGADINMAFDECITYGSGYKYSKEATERTHRWLGRCMSQVKSQKSKVKSEIQNSKFKTENCKLKIHQYLYGVIQGGTYEDLRKKSAEYVVGKDTPGVAVGGVSVGETKREMRDQVRWVSDYLPSDRPVHLLGVGQMDDIIDLVKYGIDTFDCVEPTRLARMGTLYKISNIKYQISNKSQTTNNKFKNGEIDITRGIYKNNLEKVDADCDCYVCQNFTKSYLHHLFKQHEILGYTLATFHNLWVMEKLFKGIRKAIGNDVI